MVKKTHLYRLNTAKIMKRAPVSNKKQKFNLKPSGGEKKKKKKKEQIYSNCTSLVILKNRNYRRAQPKGHYHKL